VNTSIFYDRIRSVEHEYRAAKVAVVRLRGITAVDPTILRGTEVEPSDVVRCDHFLEPTYVIRMFAEFEVALRVFWTAARQLRSPSRARAEVLMDGVAARCRISPEIHSAAHIVREYRNDLVHARAFGGILEIGECRSRLCRFLSKLPYDWPPLRSGQRRR
jgi:hypothetical protein